MRKSYEYVAGKLSITYRNYSKIENGEINISVNNLLELCEVLEIEREF
ncbi:MAG: helix-turn-helix transcriptional regulator [Bacteroidota bacterium]